MANTEENNSFDISPEYWQYRHLKHQHQVFCICLLLFLCVFGYHLYQNHLRVSSGLEISQEYLLQADLKINPNKASWEELSLLPGIGVSKANAIVNFRNEQLNRIGNESSENVSVFKSANDLNLVPGIGEKTIANISNYLFFE